MSPVKKKRRSPWPTKQFFGVKLHLATKCSTKLHWFRNPIQEIDWLNKFTPVSSSIMGSVTQLLSLNGIMKLFSVHPNEILILCDLCLVSVNYWILWNLCTMSVNCLIVFLLNSTQKCVNILKIYFCYFPVKNLKEVCGNFVEPLTNAWT